MEKTLQQGFHDDEADAIPEYPDINESGEIIQLERLVNGDEDDETEEEETEEEDEGKLGLGARKPVFGVSDKTRH